MRTEIFNDLGLSEAARERVRSMEEFGHAGMVRQTAMLFLAFIDGSMDKLLDIS